jgi:hypothetical protein
MFSTWLIILGLVLSTTGMVLRTLLMMRSSDATPRETRPLHGRELIRQYRQLFPHSPAPKVTQAALLCGVVMLCAGVAVELAH